MTSILTNDSATAALSVLRSITKQLGRTQSQVATGLRVQSASDNAAYWSIATTMRSDGSAISAARDAIGLGGATVDVAYAAMDQTVQVLDQIKEKLVSATEGSIDKSKLQDDIHQLAMQTESIAKSASFSGVNWLDTNIPDLVDADLATRSDAVVASFTRDAQGNVSVGTIGVDQLKTSLYNADGGGLLEKDPRSPGNIGGIRGTNTVTGDWNTGSWTAGSPGTLQYNFSGPLTFSSPSDQITFDVTVDTENHADPIDPPYAAGKTTAVTINRSTVDAVLPGNGGVINNNVEYVAVLNQALSATGASAFNVYKQDSMQIDPVRFAVQTDEDSGLTGSYIEISNFSSTVGSGGIGDASDFGTRRSLLDMNFEPFSVYKDVEINFDFHFNEEAPVHLKIDRALVDSVLGTDDGKVKTTDDMVRILQALITRPNTIIQAKGANHITLATDPSVDRLSGGQTGVFFSNVNVNVEPLASHGVQDIDIVKKPELVKAYLNSIQTMIQKVAAGAAMLGSLKARIEMQEAFANSALDNVNKGVGRLIDADMEESSSRLAALQTQQQLSLQTLQIANSQPNNILQLFR